MRTIDGDQAFRLLTDQLDKETGAYSKGRNAGLNVAWIKHYIKIGNFDWKYKCSMCGKFNKQYSPPYCPHCGARMDGGNDDENA